MAEPRLRVRCAGVRMNQRGMSDSGHVFFSETQYARSPFLVRVSFDSVAFVHRGTHVVERRFDFPTRVLHAVLADFSPQVLNNTIHQYAAGQVFEVALPFQANRLFPMEGRGLLLQRSPAAQIPPTASKRPRDAAAAALAKKNRRASTSNRGDGDRYKYSAEDDGTPARPRYFTLRHPLDEVKPVASKSEEEFLASSALEAVAVLVEGASLVLVAFHRWEQRFCMFRLSEVERSGRDQLMPEVRVVDGPTWTRYRARMDLEEIRVPIEPEWLATPVWKSPRVGPATSKPSGFTCTAVAIDGYSVGFVKE
uniref:Anaphase-promoting complex subunit 1 N-terminal domain-containing protein n=1 Tax=Phytophthora ramorum TaxID=164328 RepID=H3GHC7_PHYRM